MRKRGVLAAMLTGVMLVLCGCGGMTTDEAKDYVKSALDAGYKAEFKEYAEITDSTEKEAKKEKDYVQLDLFSDPQAEIDIENAVEKEKDMQKAIVNIKKKFGKNAIIKGMNLKEGATALERNKQIGGHKA